MEHLLYALRCPGGDRAVLNAGPSWRDFEAGAGRPPPGQAALGLSFHSCVLSPSDPHTSHPVEGPSPQR